MFILFGILVITFIVWLAEDEVEFIHDMPDIDSSIFKHELREIFTLIPFCFMAFVLIVNITLIITDNADEVWFYVKNNEQGISILNSILGLYILLLCFLCFALQTQEEKKIEIRHIIANSIGLM